MLGLTPYQGKCRAFGQFRCPECNRSWMSGNTWANKGQKCNKCNIYVYPFRQLPRKKSKKLNKSDMLKPHPQELCQKCHEIGASCARRRDI